MIESAIKSSCSKLLESWGWEVIHLIQTNKNGIPDTLALRTSQVVFIEFKRPGQHPEPLQVYRHGKLKNQGFPVLVVRGQGDIQHLR